MSNHYITFATSDADWRWVDSFYPEASGCRVTLQSVQKAGVQSLPAPKPWVDGGVDGLHWPKITSASYEANPSYKTYIEQFTNYRRVAALDAGREEARDFVASVLNCALKTVPSADWLSVPQLPYVAGSERNKINKLLAEATMSWKSAAKYRGKLMLPVIFTKQGQTNSKTERNPKVELAFSCFQASGASGVWIVDSTLCDQDGVGNFEDTRFPGIIDFHEEIGARLPTETVTVAGPYWGLNLVLWARGLIRFPAIGVGRSYQYHILGGPSQKRKATPRVALASLRRLVAWSPGLKKWLEVAINTTRKNESAHSEFAALIRQVDVLKDGDRARRQVAKVYKDWLLKLEGVSSDSRALTLYQDLSSAYVLGMVLKHPIPAPERVKDPAKIARQFMVNCL